MATVRLDNLTKPALKNFQEINAEKEFTKQTAFFTDIKLDMQMSKSIGNGLNVVEGSDLAISINKEAIKNSIYNIFSTKKGQMILNPNFGSSLDMFLFEKISKTSAQALGETIFSNLSKYEPRIKVNKITVLPNYDENLYRVTVDYSFLSIKELIQMQINNQGIVFL
jgi:phage baseplate assembly protein W